MNNAEIRESIKAALEGLERSGDIVITTTTPEILVNKIMGAIGVDVKTFLDNDEVCAVLNSLSASLRGIKVDDPEFHTMIGLGKDQVELLYEKVKSRGMENKKQ